MPLYGLPYLASVTSLVTFAPQLAQNAFHRPSNFLHVGLTYLSNVCGRLNLNQGFLGSGWLAGARLLGTSISSGLHAIVGDSSLHPNRMVGLVDCYSTTTCGTPISLSSCFEKHLEAVQTLLEVKATRCSDGAGNCTCDLDWYPAL